MKSQGLRVLLGLALVLLALALALAIVPTHFVVHGQTTTITLEQRLAQIETALWGGPNVAGTAVEKYKQYADAQIAANQQVQLISGDGAIAITARRGVVLLSKSSAAAITLADPVATTDDGKVIVVITTTAQAHVITDSTSGFNAKGSSGTATFTAAIGNSVELVAYQGKWYAVVKTGVAIA